MKSILTSKTFWLATLQGVAGAWVVFMTAYPEVGWLVVGKSLVDVVLRFLTTEPVKI